jgi:hypothetical protein
VSIVILGSPLAPTPPLPPDPPDLPDFLQARAGLARAGATYAGLTNFQLTLRVNDVHRGMLKNTSFRITHSVGRASTCTFQCNFPIVAGQSVRIGVDASSRLMFGGTVDRVSRAQKDGEITTYDVSCLDWIWLANAKTKIYERFENIGLNTAVSKILTYVDPVLGIRPGRIPGNLGNVTMTLDGVNFESAMTELTRARSVGWRLTPGKRVDVFQGDPDPGNQLQLVQDTRVKMLKFEEELSQVRTLVQATGGGSQVDGYHPAGSTSLAVKEAGWYTTAGGKLKLAGLPPLTYTSVSAASGPGIVSGITGITRDVSEGENLNVYLEIGDMTAQANMAARLGAGLDGVIIYTLSDGRLNAVTLATEAQRNLDFFKNPVNKVDFAMGAPDFLWNAQRNWDVGRLVTTDMESEEGDVVEGIFRISDVMLEGLADVTISDGTTYSWQINRTLRFRPGSRFGVIDMVVKG